jgi:Spy/CpxP family protein refolding chaperone
MKTAKWIALSVAATMLAGGALVYASQAGENASPQRPLRARMLARLKARLDLTDEQVAQIRTRLAGEKDTLKADLSGLRAARLGLRQAIQAPGATEASVRAASAKVAAAEADWAVERLKLRGKILPILTADQAARLGEFQARTDRAVDNAINRIGQPSGQ